MMGPKLLNRNFYQHTEIGEDYHNLCRLCLTNASSKLNFCLDDGQRRDIQGKILNCLSLIVTEDDSLPKFVCYSCVDKLEDFQDFHNMCHESEDLLKEYLSSAEKRHKKHSASSSRGSEETVPAPVSDTGFPPPEVTIKSETESADPLVCEQTSLENVWLPDESCVKAEIESIKEPPDVDISVDSNLSSQYIEETLVGKVESESDEDLMHFEGTSEEAPSGQNVSESEGFYPYDCEQFVGKVPAEDSDNDALVLSDDEDRKKNVVITEEVESQGTDSGESYLNKSYMEEQNQDVPRSVTHLPVSEGNLNEQEQPKEITECISREGEFQAEPLSETLTSKAYVDGSKPNYRRKQCIGPISNKTFSDQGELISHEPEILFNWSVSKKTFVHEADRNTIMSVHTKEKPFKCSICNKNFVREVDLSVHMRVHTKEKPFNCLICNKDFARKGDLNVHVRGHTNEKPFNCLICNKNFVRKNVLNIHMMLHSQEKPFNCSICNKDFVHKCHFNEHIRGHTKKKCFNYSICNKSFIWKYTLYMHMKVHSQEKSFNCTICNKGFARKEGLKAHMLIHTKEKPFNCSICNKGFARKGDLSTHMNVHSIEKHFKCSICNKGFVRKCRLDAHLSVHTK